VIKINKRPDILADIKYEPGELVDYATDEQLMVVLTIVDKNLNNRRSKMKKITPLIREKLSKVLFFQLQEGLYLVSNPCRTPTDPSFAEVICPLSTRHAQWQRIKSARVDHRTCMVFKDKESHLQCVTQWLKPKNTFKKG
jgi:hypothetical protein